MLRNSSYSSHRGVAAMFLKKCFRFSILVFLFLFICANILSAEFVVQTIYFQPTDAPDIDKIREKIQDIMKETQDLYKSEMNRHGFGNKTFRLQERDNKVIVHHVNGNNASHHYENNSWNRILADLPNKFNTNTEPWNKQDSIMVIIVGGIRHIDGWAWGVGWPRHSNRYGGTCINAEGSGHFNAHLIFHEIGHCFGLYHKEPNIHADGKLEHYEARWLDKHYHFNNITNNFTFPKTLKDNPIMTNMENSIIRFELDVTSNIGLHQAQIFRKSDIIVIDWDYLNGNNRDTATFEVSREKWDTTVVLQIMDTRGNYHMKDINISLPEKMDNKNPDLIKSEDIDIPDIVEESIKDNNVVYLTIMDGDTPIPNKHGLKPHNHKGEYLNGWMPDNIADNRTTHKTSIVIQGSLFERGISLTPPDDPSSSILKYDLSGNTYISFHGYIGITDDHKDRIGNGIKSCDVGGSSIFTFKIDDTILFKSDLITGKDKAIYIDFDIPSDAKVLEIVLNSSPDGNWCDMPAVADAKLIADDSVKTSHQIKISAKEKLTTSWASIKSMR